jgi:23S rRNA pseudouridine1911/1915/1917 synthase
LIAAPDDAGLRLDAFLAARGATPSRAAAQRMIEAGAVTVDGRARPKNHRVAAGERVVLAALEGQAEPQPEAPAAPAVVYEDAHVLVVDKPAGLVTHPAPGHRGTTVAELLADRAAGGSHPERAGIVHRLDRDTSGLLVVARSDEAHAALQKMLKAREITREYLALAGPLCRPARTGPATPSRTSRSSSGFRAPRSCVSASIRGGPTRSGPTSPRSATRYAGTPHTGARNAVADWDCGVSSYTQRS